MLRGVPKHTPLPVFRRFPDSTVGFPPSLPLSLGLSFFLSPPFRTSLTGLHMLQVTLQLSFSVSGRESPTAGPGHSPHLNPSHLGGVTPTLPISLREFFRDFLGFSEFRVGLAVLQLSEVFCNNLPSIAPLVSGKIFHP